MQKNASHTSRHALDARSAFLMLLMCSVALFFVDGWWGMTLFAGALLGVVVASRVSVARILACLAPLAFILACTVVAQLPHGIESGLFYATRIVLLAIATCTVAFSYSSNQFVRAFSKLLAPLRRVGLPVDDIATTFSIALRCIPGCMDELQRVVAAQRSRASRLDDGAPLGRAVAWGKVLVPMLVGMFRDASTLSQAMEARCYGAGALRTSLHADDALHPLDWAALVTCAVACATVAAVL